jgi:hypothetical protein
MWSFAYQNISIIKLTTRNRTNPCKDKAIERVSNLKDYVGIVIKLFKIKYNLIKRCLI